MTTYLTFTKRLRPLTRALSSGKISYRRYMYAFDDVLAAVGWDEQKLLSEIDKNWEN